MTECNETQTTRNIYVYDNKGKSAVRVSLHARAFVPSISESYSAKIKYHAGPDIAGTGTAQTGTVNERFVDVGR